MSRLIPCLFCCLLFTSTIVVRAEEQNSPAKIPPRDSFQIAGRQAFTILPPDASRKNEPLPWVWYAPTLGQRYPGKEEAWMFARFLDQGIAIAGIDVGESYGNPQGRAQFQALYKELTGKRGFSKKPVLLARSRGGLMLYNWAVEHPESVGGVAGIYPVCNLASYPGLKKAALAYQKTAEELQTALSAHNPIDRLAPLAEAKVPIHHIHGDQDKVVPLEENSGKLAERYRALGGPIQLDVIEGQGHNLWKGWFESESLTRFIIEQATKR